MRLRMNKIVIFLLMILLAVVMDSCRHKDLMTQYRLMTRIRLNFDWSDAPDADPEGMCVFFYPVDEPELPMRRYDFSGRDGGEIEIAVGKYRVVCYNNDTEQIQFRGIDKFDTHEAYTLPSSVFAPIYGNTTREAPRAPGTEAEDVVDTPDMMWGCSSVDMTITTRGVELAPTPPTPAPAKRSTIGLASYRAPEYRSVQLVSPNELTLFPHKQICTYTYEISDVKNLKYVSQMCASLSGMSPHMRLAGEYRSSVPSTIPVRASGNGLSSITGRFYTFGDDYEVEDLHKMVLYVWFDNGEKYYYTFDVTKQIHNAPDRLHVHLQLRGLEFPQPISSGSGFKPNVDNWDEIEEDIIM